MGFGTLLISAGPLSGAGMKIARITKKATSKPMEMTMRRKKDGELRM